MRFCYILLSPTFGMHQYTSGPANRLAQAGHEVHLVTTSHCPRGRYHPAVQVHTSVTTTSTGLSLDSLRLRQFFNLKLETCNLEPDLVHLTGPHLWNVPLLWALRRAGIPTVHTVHDVEPHTGTSRMLYAWNRAVYRLADQILVHGRCYRERLVNQGLPPEKIVYAPLLHLFCGHENGTAAEQAAGNPVYEPWALFFGRLEPYKGIGPLLAAGAQLTNPNHRVVVAGPGAPERFWKEPLTANVELHNHLIGDEEGIDLFRRCGLVVLPYLDATQSALIAAAYYFRKPVLVTRTGALPEYVQEGETGWVVEPGDVRALADTLADALSDPARLARMGQAGRAWYEEQYQIEGETLLKMYEHVRDRRAQGYEPGPATPTLSAAGTVGRHERTGQ